MQASAETKIKRLRYINGSVLILIGSVMCVVSVIDGALGQLPLSVGMILVGLLNILQLPVIVKVIGACIAIFVGAFVIGYSSVRLIFG